MVNEEKDKSVINCLTMDKLDQDPEESSRSPSPLQQETQSTSSDTDHSEVDEQELEEDTAGGPPCLPSQSFRKDSSEVQKGAKPKPSSKGVNVVDARGILREE